MGVKTMTVCSVLSVLSCVTVYDFYFVLNFRKTKEKMQIKGRIQSWNVFFIEIQKFVTFLVGKFFVQGER